MLSTMKMLTSSAIGAAALVSFFIALSAMAAPDAVLAQYPTQTQPQYPVQTPVQYPAQTQPQYPAQVQAPYPAQVQAPYPAQTQSPYPAQVQAPYPVQYPPQYAQPGQQRVPNAPFQAPPSGGPANQNAGMSSLINLNSGRFAKFEFDIVGGQFQDSSVAGLHLIATDLDMSRGLLGGLQLKVSGGQFQDFTFDQLVIASTSPVAFSTEALLNRRSFEFTQPVMANVGVVVSQKNLNQFVASPRTLQLLSSGASNHLSGLLTELIGTALAVKFQSAQVQLQPDNRVQVDVNVSIDLLKPGTAVPLSVSSKLGLADGWVNLSETRILTSGQELPAEMGNLVISRINKLAEVGRNNPDLRFTFTQLRVIPGDRFELAGSAEIKRLRFGN